MVFRIKEISDLRKRREKQKTKLPLRQEGGNMNDCLLEQKKGEVAAMDKTIAQEIVSFLSATLGIRPDDADFVKAKEGVMKEEPDYSWFFYVLGANTPSTGALAMTVETMKLRVENHIKLRGMMLKP